MSQNGCDVWTTGLSTRAAQVLMRHGFESMDAVKQVGAKTISKLSGAGQITTVEICMWAGLQPPDSMSDMTLQRQLDEAVQLLVKNGYKVVKPGLPAMQLFGPVKRLRSR